METSFTTKSLEGSARDLGTATRFQRIPDMESLQQLTTSLESWEGGLTWPTSDAIMDFLQRQYENSTLKRDGAATFLKDRHAHAMLIGTLLGDGCLPNPQCFCHSKRFSVNHCTDQADYALAKALLLSPLCPNVSTTPNPGYCATSEVIRVITKSSPALAPYWGLCYTKPVVKEDGSVSMTKYVTEAWAAELTWEAVAWWIQDDGSLSGGLYTIATHSFSEEELAPLVAWMRRHGLKKGVSIAKVAAHGKEYNTIKLNRTASIKLAELIRPFVHPSMMYKVDVSPFSETCVCQECGKTFKETVSRVKSMERFGHVYCRTCAAVVRKRQREEYRKRLGKEECRKRWREEKAANREKHNEYAKSYYIANKASIAAKAREKREAAAEIAAKNIPEVTCAYCRKVFKPTPAMYRGQVKGGVFVCTSKECRRLHRIRS